jgi:hypothetical protein
VAAGTLLLLPVDVVAQGLIKHGLELAALAFCDLAQGRQYFGRSLGGKLFADGGRHAISIMIHLDAS